MEGVGTLLEDEGGLVLATERGGGGGTRLGGPTCGAGLDGATEVEGMKEVEEVEGVEGDNDEGLFDLGGGGGLRRGGALNTEREEEEMIGVEGAEGAAGATEEGMAGEETEALRVSGVKGQTGGGKEGTLVIWRLKGRVTTGGSTRISGTSKLSTATEFESVSS